MNKLRLILIFCILMPGLKAQNENPHGNNFAMDCKLCHHADGWNIIMTEMKFDHDKETGFPLDGQHAVVDCKDCHDNLNFQGTDNNCISCHTDVHSQSVGNDCVRCHDAGSWLVHNTQDLHEENGFTLVGAHAVLSCVDCHQNENPLQWDRIGNECKDCHLDDYNNTTEPNHITAGFSDDCTFCHEPNRFSWEGDNAHFFFPLVGGHDIDDCFACHDINRQGDVYGGLTQTCVNCHLDDYNSATNPDHAASGFSQQCDRCHSIYGWSPASFGDHDSQYFPIYSGKHQGEWNNNCTSCHKDVSNYKLFTCIECHEHNNAADLAGEHGGVSGYQYESNACYSCHRNP